jgi:hypothetical protein
LKTVDRDGRQDHRARLLDEDGEQDRDEGEQAWLRATGAPIKRESARLRDSSRPR